MYYVTVTSPCYQSTVCTFSHLLIHVSFNKTLLLTFQSWQTQKLKPFQPSVNTLIPCQNSATVFELLACLKIIVLDLKSCKLDVKIANNWAQKDWCFSGISSHKLGAKIKVMGPRSWMMWFWSGCESLLATFTLFTLIHCTFTSSQ